MLNTKHLNAVVLIDGKNIFSVYRLIVMRMHSLYGTAKENKDNESSDEESEEEDEDQKPELELAMMPHYGGINRIRVSEVVNIH